MIFLKNCAVGHIPKCAGRFDGKCLVKGVTSFKKGIPNAHHAHLTPDVNSNMGIIFFVRHPYAWLRSLHAHRNRKGWNWDKRHKLELKCKHRDFSQFVVNVCDHENIIFEYFETYLNKYRKHDLKVGKVENVASDLIKFLNYFNEDFDNAIIQKMSIHGDNPAVNKLKLNDSLIGKLYESQIDFYSTYGYDK